MDGYPQGAGRCALRRDEIQGRRATLDDIHRTLCDDDMPSLDFLPVAWIKKSDKKDIFVSFRIGLNSCVPNHGAMVHSSIGDDGNKKLSEVFRAFAPCLQTNLCII